MNFSTNLRKFFTSLPLVELLSIHSCIESFLYHVEVLYLLFQVFASLQNLQAINNNCSWWFQIWIRNSMSLVKFEVLYRFRLWTSVCLGTYLLNNSASCEILLDQYAANLHRSIIQKKKKWSLMETINALIKSLKH